MEDINLDEFEKLDGIASEGLRNETMDLVKLVFLGDSGVGKTNLMTQFCSNKFLPDSKPTIGVDFAVKTVKLGKSILKLQLWDTAGQERYKSFTSAYFKDAHGVLLVYDITNRETFKNINEWLETCLASVDKQKTSIIVVANKIDLEAMRNVSYEEGKDFADKNGILFMETSALDNRYKCVDKVFYVILNDVIPKYNISMGVKPISKRVKNDMIELKNVDNREKKQTQQNKCC